MNQQIIGTITGLEQRSGGWVAVSISEPGKDYPKKLSTKKQELIGQAQQLMGQLVTAGFNEQESTNINPNNGQPYTNRYLEALAMGQVDLVGMPTQIQPQQYMPQQPQPQQYQPQPVQQQQYQPQPIVQQPIQQPQPVQQQPIMQPHGDLREAKIHRQTATKVAVELLAYLDPSERNLASLVRISEQLVQYYDNGVQWTTPPVQPQAPQPQAPQPQGQQQHQGGYENPAEGGQQPYYGEPDPDDGIPF